MIPRRTSRINNYKSYIHLPMRWKFCWVQTLMHVEIIGLQKILMSVSFRLETRRPIFAQVTTRMRRGFESWKNFNWADRHKVNVRKNSVFSSFFFIVNLLHELFLIIEDLLLVNQHIKFFSFSGVIVKIVTFWIANLSSLLGDTNISEIYIVSIFRFQVSGL